MLTEIKAELVTGHSTSTAQAGVQNSTPNVTPSNESMIEIYRNTLVEIVDSWQEMLRTPPINNSVQVIADKVINPFLYDEPLRDRDVYCPRRRIESRLSRAWTNKHLHPIELVGPTLIGKTSFIQVITDQFPAIVFETVSFEHLNTHINPLARIAYAISDALTTNYPELRPKFPQITKEPFRQVEHLVRQRCMNQDDANLWGMVLVLDDFDYADRIVDRLQYQQFIHFLFHLSESLSNFGLVVLRTVGQNGYFDRHRSDSLRSSFPLRLTAFRSGRASPPYRTVFYQFLNLQLLGQDATDFPCRFSRAAEHRIVVLTGGHPFLIQLIA